MATILAVKPKQQNELPQPTQTIQPITVSTKQSTRREPRSPSRAIRRESDALERFRPAQAFPDIQEYVGRGVQHNRPRRSEILAVVQCEDTDCYEILITWSGTTLSDGGFETLTHCNAALKEIEDTFVLGSIEAIEPETLEAIKEIIYQHWCREQIELELAIA